MADDIEGARELTIQLVAAVTSAALAQPITSRKMV